VANQRVHFDPTLCAVRTDSSFAVPAAGEEWQARLRSTSTSESRCSRRGQGHKVETGALLDRYLAAVGEPLRFADRACDFPYLALYLLMLDVILRARGPILCPDNG